MKWREYGPVVSPPASGGALADHLPPIHCGGRPLPPICCGSLRQDLARPPRGRFPAVRAASGRPASAEAVSRACGVAAAGRGARQHRQHRLHQLGAGRRKPSSSTRGVHACGVMAAGRARRVAAADCDARQKRQRMVCACSGRLLRGPSRDAKAAGRGVLQARQEQLLPLCNGRQQPSEPQDFVLASTRHQLDIPTSSTASAAPTASPCCLFSPSPATNSPFPPWASAVPPPPFSPLHPLPPPPANDASAATVLSRARATCDQLQLRASHDRLRRPL